MKQDDFDAYKKAIKQHYEKEKSGYYSGFLLSPSRANLRKLCVERMKDNTSIDDHNTFRLFTGFDFKPENKNRLKDETDRFRAIENFLREKTDTNDLETINLTAILINFSARPFLKFVRSTKNENDIVLENVEVETVISDSTSKEKEPRKKRKLIFWLLGVVALLSMGYTAKDLFLPAKECMQWQIDHYEPVECLAEVTDSINFGKIEALDETLLDFKKIEVNKHFPFFKDGKATVWYYKVNDEELEYFNGTGNGHHPLLNKPLHPITKHMINRYVKNE